MAKSTKIVPAAVKTDVIEELSKVYCVNGAFYRTRAEAELSLLKADLYQTYLNRAGYSRTEKERMTAQVAKSNYHNVLVYVDDVIRLLAEKGITLVKEEDAAAV